MKMDDKDKNMLVFGAGISGVGAAALLLDKGAYVTLYDGNAGLDAAGAKKKIEERCASAENLDIVFGEFPDALYGKTDIAVLSPGIPTDLEVVNKLRDMGKIITGEVELAYTVGKGVVYAVTGTNGKTTTTTLLGELMKAAHKNVDVVGNIGNPYTEAAEHQQDDTVTVAEISSFQLETIHTFHPHAAVITNITEDHLNRHHTMENYINTKQNIALNMTKDDLLVLNYEDEILRDFGHETAAKVCYFSSAGRPGAENASMCLYLDGEDIIVECSEGKNVLINTSELQLVGLHNFENVMCAAAVALFDGMDPEAIRTVLKGFAGVEHRIEFVGEFDGVRYYNDSKGTNPAAAIKGINAMKWPTLLIAGGYDKQSSYEEWINCFDGKVKYLVLIGQTKEKIAAAAESCGLEKDRIILCEDLKEAVDFCRKNAVSGDAVLLSPACASWGQFDNYEQRGDIFKEYVRSR